MKSAQIITGIINGVADWFESPNILSVISADKLTELTSLDNIREKPYYRVFVNDYIVAATTVKPSEPDRYGRAGTVNHTVIYRFDSVIERDGYFYYIPKDQFDKDARNGKFQFKMPSMPELKKPLDQPPTPEWGTF
jgi:hypothetical protein